MQDENHTENTYLLLIDKDSLITVKAYLTKLHRKYMIYRLTETLTMTKQWELERRG